MRLWPFGRNNKTSNPHASSSHKGMRIDEQGRVFLQSDKSEVELKLKEVSGSQLIYEPFEIGDGEFVRGVLHFSESLLNDKLQISYFALDLSNRHTHVHYITSNPLNVGHGPSFSPEAKKCLIATHRANIQYKMKKTWYKGMDWGHNDITLWGVSDNAGSRSGGSISFNPQGAWQQSGVLYVPVSAVHTMFMEAAMAQGIQIPNQSYSYSEGDKYAADVAAAAMYDDKGAKHRPLLLIDTKTGKVNLAIEDAQGTILQQSKTAIATADRELVEYLAPQCADKGQDTAQPPSAKVKDVLDSETKSNSNTVALAALIAGGATAIAGLYQRDKDKKKAEKQRQQETKKTAFSGSTALISLGVLAMGCAAAYLLFKPAFHGVQLRK